MAALTLTGPGGAGLALGDRGRAQPPRDLSISSRVEAELTPGDEHRYRLVLSAGRCVKVVAAQIGIDLKLVLQAPDGSEAARADERSSGDEVLLAIPAVDGAYELRVAAAADHLPPGRYGLIVEDADPGDARLQAFRHQIEGRRLAEEAKNRTDRAPEALGEFTGARDAWDRIGESAMAAYCSFEIGSISKHQLQPAAAKEAFADAVRRFDALGKKADSAAAQNGLAETLSAEGDSRAAVAQWRSILKVEDALTPVDRVVLHYNYGSSVSELGDYASSLDELRRAVAAFHELGMIPAELGARTELASVYVMQRDLVHALEELTRGLALSREQARPDMEARFLHRLGLVYWEAGDDDAAAEQWRNALSLYRGAASRVGEASVLLELGDYTARHGDPQEALANYQKAHEILLAVGSKEGQARALTRLGSVFTKRGDYPRAAELEQQALELQRSMGNRQGEVLALLNLGETRSAAGDRPAARALLTTALSLTREAGAGIAEPEILGDLALIERDEGNLAGALAKLDEVIEKLESEQRAALVPSLQATLSGDAQVWYAARIEILMRRHLRASRAGWDAKALETAERARARALLGLLAESHADIRKGVSPALLDRYRSLQVQLAAAAESHRGSAEAHAPGGAGGDEQRVADLTSRLQLVEAEIRRLSPGYAALTQPSPLNLDAIRRRVLDGDTVLLEFMLGEERSWLWAVSKKAIVSAPLPPAAEIEGAAQRLYALISARPSGGTSGTLETEAAALSRMLLQPLAGRLAGGWRARRLAIVSAGALECVPFGVLPVPGASGNSETPVRRLIDDHEIVSLPSASVLDLMRREVAGRRPARLRLALLGDPVFGADDPRVRHESAAASGDDRSRAEAGDTEGGDEEAPPPRDAISGSALVVAGPRGFPRLPFSRDEVKSIAALLPEGEAFKAMDFQASRALATSGALGRYRILHFATHGLLNARHPELSGLVLSLVDESGRPLDGFLRLQDIYNLRLSADLAVLSACRSALGRQIAGEGLMGLTRGFMYAGAPRVVASLWQVDDSATAALMTEFYRGIFQEGLRPAAALQAAQKRIAGERRWSEPFFWAGFTLEGDWR